VLIKITNGGFQIYIVSGIWYLYLKLGMVASIPSGMTLIKMTQHHAQQSDTQQILFRRMAVGIMALWRMTLSRLALSRMALSRMALGRMVLSLYRLGRMQVSGCDCNHVAQNCKLSQQSWGISIRDLSNISRQKTFFVSCFLLFHCSSGATTLSLMTFSIATLSIEVSRCDITSLFRIELTS